MLAHLVREDLVVLIELDPVKALEHLKNLVGVDTGALVLDMKEGILPS